jgi:hypothetical protein
VNASFERFVADTLRFAQFAFRLLSP